MWYVIVFLAGVTVGVDIMNLMLVAKEGDKHAES